MRADDRSAVPHLLNLLWDRLERALCASTQAGVSEHIAEVDVLSREAAALATAVRLIIEESQR